MGSKGALAITTATVVVAVVTVATVTRMAVITTEMLKIILMHLSGHHQKEIKHQHVKEWVCHLQQ